MINAQIFKWYVKAVTYILEPNFDLSIILVAFILLASTVTTKNVILGQKAAMNIGH